MIIRKINGFGADSSGNVEIEGIDGTTATVDTNGLLSKEDKLKLDGMSAGATNTIVTNTLTSQSATEALSANMGKTLSDTLTSHTDNTEIHVTDVEKDAWNNKADELYVDGKVAELVDTTPQIINTLDELNVAIQNTDNALDGLLTTLSTKVNQTELSNALSAKASSGELITHLNTTVNDRAHGMGSIASKMYDSGNWIPTLKGEVTEGNFVASNQVGTYTRIGDAVFCNFRLVGELTGAEGRLCLNGMPYTPSSKVDLTGFLIYQTIATDASVFLSNLAQTQNVLFTSNGNQMISVHELSGIITVYGSFSYTVN